MIWFILSITWTAGGVTAVIIGEAAFTFVPYFCLGVLSAFLWFFKGDLSA